MRVAPDRALRATAEAEGEGVKPDIDVPSDPNAFVKGVDPQLDRGIAWLLEEARKNPRPDVRPPRDRNFIGRGGG